MGLVPGSRLAPLLAALMAILAAGTGTAASAQAPILPGQADNYPPLVSMEEPFIEGSYYSFLGTWRIFVNFSYSDPSGIFTPSVAYYLDGVQVLPEATVTPRWAAAWITVTNGHHSGRFVVSDNLGNEAAYDFAFSVYDATAFDFGAAFAVIVVAVIVAYGIKDMAGWAKRRAEKPPEKTESDIRMRGFIETEADGAAQAEGKNEEEKG